MYLRTASAMLLRVEEKQAVSTRTQDTPWLILRRPQVPLTAIPVFCLRRGGNILCCDPRQANPTDMKTADVPYAADAEVSLTFDELKVRLYYHLSFLNPS